VLRARIQLAILTVLSVGVLAGCGSAADTAADTRATTPGPTVVSSSTPAATHHATAAAHRKKHHRHHEHHAAPTPTPTPTPTHHHKRHVSAPILQQGCTPLTNGGNCYEPGEFCRNSDHGVTGVAGDGKRIRCEDSNGWRWEPI